VRALSQADVVVADVSGYDSGIMMLLGVRSVIKRGVNITTTDKEITAEVWEDIPFNLKEINPLSHRQENKLRLAQLSEAIREGLTQLDRSPHYQDLPVYDYVRNFGKGYNDYKPVRKEERVLFLRSFRDSYQPNIWEFVRQSFRFALEQASLKPRKENNQPRLESIIDEHSPRLVGQRLYEAIRLTDLCVVDFTDWRPNVFYELGVRLSVNKLGPICIINWANTGVLSDSQTSLVELFQPFKYVFGGPETPFRNALKAFEKMHDLNGANYCPNNARLAHDETYRIVSRNFTLNQERFGDSVEDSLISSVDVVAGGDDQENVDPTLLYGRENATLARKIREGVLERLCAAWLYTDGREQPAQFTMHDVLDPRRRSIFRKYRRISARLSQKLEGRTAERDQNLRQLLAERLVSIRRLSDFDDDIREWEALEEKRTAGSSLEEFRKYQVYGRLYRCAKRLLETFGSLRNIERESLPESVRAGLGIVETMNQNGQIET